MTHIVEFLFQAVTSAAVLAAVGGLVVLIWRDVLGRWIAGWLQHDFDKSLETFRSELRKAEETFKSEIRANEQRVKSVADIALGTLSGRQTALDARRLLTVERMWAQKAKLDGAKVALRILG